MANDRVWFLVADAGRARLMEARRLPHGRLHVDEHEALRNHDAEHEHEHGRPSPRAGKHGNTYASGGHEDEQQLHRFAKEVVGWIEQKLAEHSIDRLELFSAPRFLGELRGLYRSAMRPRIEEHQADLTQMTAAGMARHPAIRDLFPD